MYQDWASKHWYTAIIDRLCSEPRSYKIITRDGIVYRKSHLKPFTPQNKMSQSSKCVSSLMAQSNHMQPVKTESKKSQVNNQLQVQTSRPERETMCQSSLISNYFKCLLSAYLDIYCFIVFTSVCKCPCNRAQATQSCICLFMHLHIKWTMATHGLWCRPLNITCELMFS